MNASKVLREIAWIQRELCDGLKHLGENEHFAIHLDEACRLVLVQRKPSPFRTSGELVRSFQEVERILARVPRQEFKFLGDTTKGPARNDPRYEEDMKRMRPTLLGGYQLSATLTKTVVGQMQVRRYAQQDGRKLLVTSDVRDAFSYLGLRRHILPELGLSPNLADSPDI